MVLLNEQKSFVVDAEERRVSFSFFLSIVLELFDIHYHVRMIILIQKILLLMI